MEFKNGDTAKYIGNEDNIFHYGDVVKVIITDHNDEILVANKNNICWIQKECLEKMEESKMNKKQMKEKAIPVVNSAKAEDSKNYKLAVDENNGKKEKICEQKYFEMSKKEKKKFKKLQKIAKKSLKFMKKYCNPNQQILVTFDGVDCNAQVMTGEYGVASITIEQQELKENKEKEGEKIDEPKGNNENLKSNA